MCIEFNLKRIEGVTEYFESYRNAGFSSSLKSTKEIGNEMGVDAFFPVKRYATRKNRFDIDIDSIISEFASRNAKRKC
jgi:hypothetical protein